jgi:L-threonine-O-3-phosphate decarboxylase
LTSVRPQHGGNLSWAAALAGCPPRSILDFSANINPLGPPQSILRAIEAHLEDLRSYPDPGTTVLRQRLSQRHELPPDWIWVGNGAAEVLTWACRSLSNSAQTHLFTPAFSDYWRALRAFDANICPHLASPEEIVSGLAPQTWLASLAATVTHPSVSEPMGLLLNTPHNPTGQVLAKADLQPLLDAFQLVVVDEAFIDFLPSAKEDSLCTELEQHPNLVIVRSLTKFYSIPGLRLGYALGHPDILQQWQVWRDPWSVNTLAIAAGVAALQDSDFSAQTQHWLATAAPQLRKGLAALPGLTVCPGSVNFVLVRCDYPVLPFQETLLKRHHILIRDCTSFPELGNHYFRVAVRTEAENERLLQGLAETLTSLKPSTGHSTTDSHVLNRSFSSET